MNIYSKRIDFGVANLIFNELYREYYFVVEQKQVPYFIRFNSKFHEQMSFRVLHFLEHQR